MDVSSILDTYNTHSGTGYQLAQALPLLAVFVPAGTALGYWLVTKDKDAPAWLILSGSALGVSVAVILAWMVGMVDPYVGDEMAASVSEEAKGFYGVEIPVDAIEQAYESASRGVTVSVGSEHEGVRKSLDIGFDLDAQEFTVYQGNVELEPVQ